MILDRGICSIFRRVDIAAHGDMPRYEMALIGQSWYGENDFASSPAWPTEGRRENRTDAKIRILQNRSIRENDIAVLTEAAAWTDIPEETTIYEITRCYHGTDDDGPTEITDLNMEVTEP